MICSSANFCPKHR